MKITNPTDYLGTIVHHFRYGEGVLTFASDDTPAKFAKVRFVFIYNVFEVSWWFMPRDFKQTGEKLTLSPFPDRLNGHNSPSGIGICEYEVRRALEARAQAVAA